MHSLLVPAGPCLEYWKQFPFFKKSFYGILPGMAFRKVILKNIQVKRLFDVKMHVVGLEDCLSFQQKLQYLLFLYILFVSYIAFKKHVYRQICETYFSTFGQKSVSWPWNPNLLILKIIYQINLVCVMTIKEMFKFTLI